MIFDPVKNHFRNYENVTKFKNNHLTNANNSPSGTTKNMFLKCIQRKHLEIIKIISKNRARMAGPEIREIKNSTQNLIEKN